jgi:RNA polymerase sigma-70 factor (ECF subfamily)
VTDLKSHSDRELYELLLLKEHKDGAFREIYRRHSPRIHAYCLRVTGDRDEAKDVFQDTFTRFMGSIRADREMTNLPAFLLRIARNLCLNRKRDTVATVDVDNVVLASHDMPYEKRELLQLITTSLDLLPQEYREAFVLREYDGMSYAEIAEIAGVSEEAARIRAFRARNKIREILAPYLADLQK